MLIVMMMQITTKRSQEHKWNSHISVMMMTYATLDVLRRGQNVYQLFRPNEVLYTLQQHAMQAKSRKDI